MPMQTSPSQLRTLAQTLREEAIELDAAAITLEAALAVVSTRTNAGQIAESNIGGGLTAPLTPSVPEPATVKEYRIPWGQKAAALDPEFIEGLFWIEDQINLDPVLLVPCMHFESKLNPKARNPASSASGLIQFMSATAIALGTTIEKIRAMGPMEQLGFVHKYFKSIRKDWSGATLCDVYLAILWPKGIGLPETANIFVKGTQTYAVNAGLDKDKDGYVTKSEICDRLWKEAKLGLYEDQLLVVTRT